MTTINYPAEKILSACDRAVEQLNDTILFNSNIATSEVRLGESAKTQTEIIKEYEEKRKPFYRIQALNRQK
jgi:hypothetical protein